MWRDRDIADEFANSTIDLPARCSTLAAALLKYLSSSDKIDMLQLVGL